LLTVGWAIGMLVIGRVLRFGSGAEALAWGLLFAVMPLSGVFTPAANLPGGVQPVAKALPTTHAFIALRSAVAIEVDDAQLDALQKNPNYAHLSGDLTVTADMAITNKVTGATSVWQGTPGLLGLLGTPGYTGTGVGVAILDSGIATHTALDSRVVARVNLVTDEPNVAGDPFGHGTHIAGIVAGNRSAATYVTSAFSGGTAPSVKLIDVRVLGSRGAGRTSDVIAGIDWVIENRLQMADDVIWNGGEEGALDPQCARAHAFYLGNAGAVGPQSGPQHGGAR
jgi:subtilisin family serine protease